MINKNISILTLIFFLSACGVQFEQVALYDKYEEPAPQEKVERIIYEDGAGTMWNSLFDCGSFELVKDVYYAGNSSIKISWDKSKGCEWIGFGNSFSNWAPTNVAEYQNEKALSFYVRTQQNTARGIPIVLGMQDFAGGGTYLFTEAKKYLYGLEIDTTWKQFIVPLWHFATDPGDGRNDDVDISSIKQMVFQLEGAGSFYLDEIKFIDFSEEQYQKMLADVEAMKPKGNINQTVYREGNLKHDVWGYGETFCQTLEEVTEDSGETYISWEFRVEDCNWAKWGINWNDWYQANFRGIVDDAMLQFKIKTTTTADFDLIIEDYAGHSAQVYSSFSTGKDVNEWRTIEIPLSKFELEENNFVLDQIKQLVFVGKTSGTVLIDDIKIMDAWKY